MTDDIVGQLRQCDNLACGADGSPYGAQCVRCEAADEIERLRGLVAELLPAALNDAEQGIMLGPSSDANDFCLNCDKSCPDCKWYSGSVAFMERYNNGYYS